MLTRPDFIEDVHRAYFDAGADCVETNTFGANKVVLGEFGLADKAYEISRRASEIARRLADEYATPEWPRFVLGSVGPGTKLARLGHLERLVQRLEPGELQRQLHLHPRRELDRYRREAPGLTVD